MYRRSCAGEAALLLGDRKWRRDTQLNESKKKERENRSKSITAVQVHTRSTQRSIKHDRCCSVDDIIVGIHTVHTHCARQMLRVTLRSYGAARALAIHRSPISGDVSLSRYRSTLDAERSSRRWNHLISRVQDFPALFAFAKWGTKSNLSGPTIFSLHSWLVGPTSDLLAPWGMAARFIPLPLTSS